jgi:hypothetical protein
MKKRLFLLLLPLISLAGCTSFDQLSLLRHLEPGYHDMDEGDVTYSYPMAILNRWKA